MKSDIYHRRRLLSLQFNGGGVSTRKEVQNSIISPLPSFPLKWCVIGVGTMRAMGAAALIKFVLWGHLICPHTTFASDTFCPAHAYVCMVMGCNSKALR